MISPGEMYAGYVVLEKIGFGAMGEVFLARHRFLNRVVALKVLRPVHSGETGVLRFLDEARAAASIAHPTAVHVFDCGVFTDGRAFIAMERLTGCNLREALQQGARDHWQPPLLAALLGEIARGLQAAHDQGIVHRDIKPENLFLQLVRPDTAQIQLKLLDFGVAKLRRQDRITPTTAGGMVIGTPQYMSPEQCIGRPDIDHRTDIYALGCVAFELLTGQPVYDATSLPAMLIAQASSPPPDLAELDPSLPEALVGVVEAMLRKEREERPRSMLEIIDGLANFLECGTEDFGRYLPASALAFAARESWWRHQHLPPIDTPVLPVGYDQLNERPSPVGYATQPAPLTSIGLTNIGLTNIAPPYSRPGPTKQVPAETPFHAGTESPGLPRARGATHWTHLLLGLALAGTLGLSWLFLKSRAPGSPTQRTAAVPSDQKPAPAPPTPSTGVPLHASKSRDTAAPPVESRVEPPETLVPVESIAVEAREAPHTPTRAPAAARESRKTAAPQRQHTQPTQPSARVPLAIKRDSDPGSVIPEGKRQNDAPARDTKDLTRQPRTATGSATEESAAPRSRYGIVQDKQNRRYELAPD